MTDKYLFDQYHLTPDQLQDWRTLLGSDVLSGFRSIRDRSLELFPDRPPYTLFNLLSHYSGPSFKDWNSSRKKVRSSIIVRDNFTPEQLRDWKSLLGPEVLSGYKSVSARSRELLPDKDSAYLHHILSRSVPDYVSWYKSEHISKNEGLLDRLDLKAEDFQDWRFVLGKDVVNSEKSINQRSLELFPDQPEATLFNILNSIDPPGFKDWVLNDYHFHKNWQSVYEKKLLNDIFPSYNIRAVQYNNLPGRRQIDVYLPELKVGFELNGYYFHSLHANSSSKFDVNYHRDKTTIAKHQGIKLYQFWYESSKDTDRLDLITSVILSKIGKFQTKYFARKLLFKEVTFHDALNFYSINHLQGAPNKHNLYKCFGLYDGDVLVSCLSYSYRYNYGLELIRFATLRHSCVVGGFSRLFKHSLKFLPNEDIISYGDRDLIPDPYDSVYSRNGFRLVESNLNKIPLQLSYYVPKPINLDKLYQGVYTRQTFQKSRIANFVKDPFCLDHLDLLGIFPCYNSGTWKFLFPRYIK